jgi:hypothetical protein
MGAGSWEEWHFVGRLNYSQTRRVQRESAPDKKTREKEADERNNVKDERAGAERS